MITELGHYALILAFLVAIAQAIIPLVGAHNRWPGWMVFAEPAANAQFLLTAFSFGALTCAFITSDFSLEVVVAGGKCRVIAQHQWRSEHGCTNNLMIGVHDQASPRYYCFVICLIYCSILTSLSRYAI